MAKRMGSILLSLIIISCMIPACFAAQPALTVRTPSAYPKAGERFKVYVDIAGNPGFCAMQFTLHYDKAAMTCTAASVGRIGKDMMAVTNPNGADGAILAAANITPVEGDGPVGEFYFTAQQDMNDWDLFLQEVSLGAQDGSEIALRSSGEQSREPIQQPGEDPSVQSADKPPVTFTDTVGHWGEADIAKAAQMGLFGGYPDGSFHPDDPITRADFVTVLWRAAGSPSAASSGFADVPQDAYYAKAVAWAKQKGIVDGISADAFDPMGVLTRQAAMKILFGFSGGQSGQELLFATAYDSAFADSASIADWAKAGMYWGCYNELIAGMGNGCISPQTSATRAQLAKILVKYTELFGVD